MVMGVPVTEHEAVSALAALAQQSRLAVFRLLVQAAEPMAAGEIARQLEVSPSTLSFHLKELAQAGLVTVCQEGRFMYYAPDRQAFAALLAYLTENCCAGAGCPVSEQDVTSCCG